MKTHHLVAAAALFVPAAAFATDGGEALFKKYNCSACHAPASKSVGPSLAEIATKYKDNKDAQAKLEAKTRSGGAGSFGAMPMPPTAKTVSDGDIKTMIMWVLSQK